MLSEPRARRPFALLAVLALLTLLMAPSVLARQPDRPPGKPVDVQILGLNDFHGQLEPVDATVSSGGRIGPTSGPSSAPVCDAPTCIEAGGVSYLATHVEQLRATNPDNTVFVSAGDLIGATPLLSALFHDEPTIEAFNLMGLDYNGVGNHEFDEGVGELLRVAYGTQSAPGYTPPLDGCHPVDGCGDADPYHGADFPFLAANVTYKSTGQPIFAPYEIHEFTGGARVAFVGMTLEDTPLIVSPDGISSVNFLDEAASVNALVPVLRAQGVRAIVVLLHEGGSVNAPSNGAGSVDTINSCTDPTGPLPDVVAAMDDEVDIVITGHTNWAVNCLIDEKVVTGAASQGRLITDIDARVSPKSGDFVGDIVVNNRIVTRDVEADPDLEALIAEYKVYEEPIASVRVGSTTAAMDRGTLTPARESTLGRLIADAQLASSSLTAGAQIAFMNPGGIRANLAAGDISYGQAFNVQPFSNVVTTKTMTGAQIEQVLEQQFVRSSGGSRTTVLQVSDGFTYTWDSRPTAAGDRVDPATIKLNGVTLDPGTGYRVTMNSFLASGGDDFPAFKLGTNVVVGDDDLVALVAYLGANDPYTPVATERITVILP